MKHVQIIPDQHVYEPQTDIERLMMTFGEEVDRSDKLAIASAVMDVVEDLADGHREIIEALFYEQCSYSELGEKLGVSKPHAWRRAQRSLEVLRYALLKHPLIEERFGQ